MAASLFFYDVETSGLNPRSARIMQFAGQRTTMDLQPIGEPIDAYIKLTPDVLPDPEAILVTGITPQMTQADGLTEAAFLKLFYEQVVKPDTIFVGYNSVRFDDEFMRFLHYRNYYDAYAWQSKNGNSRWDLLDVVRMTRALRPAGIAWPVDSSGKASNRLTLLTSLNKLDHAHAHEALNDVMATIALAQLIKQNQPKLFDFLLALRTKQAVSKLVLSRQPFVYSSGSYPSEFEKTTVAAAIGDPQQKRSVLVYDLRFDPKPFSVMSPAELMQRWQMRHDDASWEPFPVKVLQFNRVPAVAPLSVVDKESERRLQLDLPVIEKHYQALLHDSSLIVRLQEVQKLLHEKRQIEWTSGEQVVDEQLYDGFYDDHDERLLEAIHSAQPDSLSHFIAELHDPRLKAMLPLYKARNFPHDLSQEERESWDAFYAKKLLEGENSSRLARYLQRLAELAATPTSPKQSYVLEELRLYGESLMPA